MEFKDRVANKPNRVKLTYDEGGASVYATIELADEPIEEGTPINAENMNKLLNKEDNDYIVEQGTLEFDMDPTVDRKVTWYYRKWNSGLAECWTRRIIETSIATVPEANVGSNFFVGENTFGKVTYPIAFTVSPYVQFTITYAKSNFTYPVLKQYSEHFYETPEYFIASPYKVTGTGTYWGCYYVTGRWK